MYDPPRAVFDFSGLSGLGQAGKLLQNYLGFAHRADRLVSGWTKPFAVGFERLRRATEFYPVTQTGSLFPRGMSGCTALRGPPTVQTTTRRRPVSWTRSAPMAPWTTWSSCGNS